MILLQIIDPSGQEVLSPCIMSQEYEYELQPELNRMENFIETVFVEFIVPSNKNILIGTFYRPLN